MKNPSTFGNNLFNVIKTEVKAVHDNPDQQKNDWVIVMHDQPLILDSKALCCFKDTKFRRALLWLVEWKWFERIMLLCIFVGSFAMLFQNRLNPITAIDTIQDVFTYVFTVESMLKIISYGFVVHRHSYLRYAWNWLDIIVVIIGIAEQIDSSFPNLKSLRILRMLRILNQIKHAPSLKRLIRSLILSVKDLLNVVVFFIFVFLLFGIIGVQLFGNSFYNLCRTTPAPYPNGSWPIDQNVQRVCGGQFECPAGSYCGNPLTLTPSIPLSPDQDYKDNSLINYGITSFDNIGRAVLSLF